MASLVLGVTLVTYFNGVMHYDIADAATQVTNYSGTSYILTVLVAILADTYIGRFKAVLISCWIEFLVCIFSLYAVYVYLNKKQFVVTQIFTAYFIL